MGICRHLLAMGSLYKAFFLLVRFSMTSSLVEISPLIESRVERSPSPHMTYSGYYSYPYTYATYGSYYPYYSLLWGRKKRSAMPDGHTGTEAAMMTAMAVAEGAGETLVTFEGLT